MIDFVFSFQDKNVNLIVRAECVKYFISAKSPKRVSYVSPEPDRQTPNSTALFENTEQGTVKKSRPDSPES